MAKRAADGEVNPAAMNGLGGGLPDVLSTPVGDLGPAAFHTWLRITQFGLQPPAPAGDARNAFMDVDIEAGPDAKLRMPVLLNASYAEWLRELDQKHRAAWEALPRKGDATWQWQHLTLDGEAPRITMNVMLGRGSRSQHRRTVVKVKPPGERKLVGGLGWAFLAPLMREYSNFRGCVVRLQFAMARYE